MRAALLVLLAALAPAVARSQAVIAVEDVAITWREDFPGFGSYSGLVLSDDGTRFITVSDKGSFAIGRLHREGGSIRAVEHVAHGPLRDPDGEPVRRFDVDAEGLTLGPDGALYVSFEANHRVWAYADLAGPARALPRHIARDALQNNSSLEALFTGADGAILTIPERSGKLERPFPVHRLSGGKWGYAGTVPRSGRFLVTGADMGPDGKLYLLERDYQKFSGFAIRIRRFDFGPDGARNGETLMEAGPGRYDNLEGIVAWRDGAGQIRLTTISDDNQGFFQRTEFVEFVVQEAGAG